MTQSRRSDIQCSELPKLDPPIRTDMIDYPTGFRLQKLVGTDADSHLSDRCSCVQTNGAVLCDCGAIAVMWMRHGGAEGRVTNPPLSPRSDHSAPLAESGLIVSLLTKSTGIWRRYRRPAQKQRNTVPERASAQVSQPPPRALARPRLELVPPAPALAMPEWRVELWVGSEQLATDALEGALEDLRAQWVSREVAHDLPRAVIFVEPAVEGM